MITNRQYKEDMSALLDIISALPISNAYTRGKSVQKTFRAIRKRIDAMPDEEVKPEYVQPPVFGPIQLKVDNLESFEKSWHEATTGYKPNVDTDGRSITDWSEGPQPENNVHDTP